MQHTDVISIFKEGHGDGTARFRMNFTIVTNVNHVISDLFRIQQVVSVGKTSKHTTIKIRGKMSGFGAIVSASLKHLNQCLDVGVVFSEFLQRIIVMHEITNIAIVILKDRQQYFAFVVEMSRIVVARARGRIIRVCIVVVLQNILHNRIYDGIVQNIVTRRRDGKQCSKQLMQ